MGRYFRCKDFYPRCDFEAIGDDLEDLLDRVRPHLAYHQGITAPRELILTALIRIRFSWVSFFSVLALPIVSWLVFPHHPEVATLLEFVLPGAVFTMIIFYLLAYHYEGSLDTATVWFNRVYGATVALGVLVVASYAVLKIQFRPNSLTLLLLAVGYPVIVFHRCIQFNRELHVKIEILERTLLKSVLYTSLGLGVGPMGLSLLTDNTNFYSVSLIRQASYLARLLFLAWFGLVSYRWLYPDSTARLVRVVQKPLRTLKISVAGSMTLIFWMTWLFLTTDFAHQTQYAIVSFIAPFVVLPAWLIQAAVLHDRRNSASAYNMGAVTALIGCSSWLLEILGQVWLEPVFAHPLFPLLGLVSAAISIGKTLWGLVTQDKPAPP